MGVQEKSMKLMREADINILGNKNLVESICHRHCLGHWVNQRNMVIFVNKSSHSSIVLLLLWCRCQSSYLAPKYKREPFKSPFL